MPEHKQEELRGKALNVVNSPGLFVAKSSFDSMVLLLRSNDVIFLNWIIALLEGAGVAVLLLDQHASIMEGSIGAIPRRLMVPRDEVELARQVLHDAEVDFEQDPTYDR